MTPLRTLPVIDVGPLTGRCRLRRGPAWDRVIEAAGTPQRP